VRPIQPPTDATKPVGIQSLGDSSIHGLVGSSKEHGQASAPVNIWHHGSNAMMSVGTQRIKERSAMNHLAFCSRRSRHFGALHTGLPEPRGGDAMNHLAFCIATCQPGGVLVHSDLDNPDNAQIVRIHRDHGRSSGPLQRWPGQQNGRRCRIFGSMLAGQTY
jgi:hypothetical protein